MTGAPAGPRSCRAWLRAALLAGLAALLSACAFSPAFQSPGTPRAEVVRHLGNPYSAQPLPGGGERLLYTTQPSGREIYHVDFDAAGLLVRTEQVLTSSRLHAIPFGQWTLQDLRAYFGPPMLVERVASFDGVVWTYRFMEDINLRRLAHVHIDAAGIVRKVMFTDEPVPDDRFP